MHDWCKSGISTVCDVIESTVDWAGPVQQTLQFSSHTPLHCAVPSSNLPRQPNRLHHSDISSLNSQIRATATFDAGHMPATIAVVSLSVSWFAGRWPRRGHYSLKSLCAGTVLTNAPHQCIQLSWQAVVAVVPSHWSIECWSYFLNL